MSKRWSETHNVAKPLDFKNKEESLRARSTPTAPARTCSSSRAPGIKTVYKRNPAYWGKVEGNVQEIVFTPIANDATRLAALVSGELDFVLDPAPRDVARLRNTPGVKVIDGPENRVLFIGMDQGRDELLYSSVKGRNPFKDLRVRQALYQAIDIETIKTKLMNGQSVPDRRDDAVAARRLQRPELEKRLPFDLAAARGSSWPTPATPKASRSSSTARTTATSTTRDLHRAGRDVGADEGQGQGRRRAAGDLLPEAREVRLQHVHARLGRRGDRCRDRR